MRTCTSSVTVNGRAVARIGNLTSCGAVMVTSLVLYIWR
ncbi:PAAR domain-containing protein [Paraburkholderia caledonica]